MAAGQVGGRVDFDGRSAAAIAEEYGLRQVGVRPPLGRYLRDLWRRRDFAVVMSSSSAYEENQNTRLGQLWAVIKPALDALVYVVIFGILLDTSRGVENAVAFIIVGVFAYRFFSGAVTSGAKSVANNLKLLRSLHFPRAILPISAVLEEVVLLLPALVVMVAMVWASGLLPRGAPVSVTWELALLPLAILLLGMFALGVSLFLARLAAGARDLLNMLPFLLRVLFYGSGVLFSIDHYVKHEAIATLMQYQPVAVYLNLARQVVLSEPTIPISGSMWVAGVVWASLALGLGFIFFWRAEARYGRE